MTDYHSSGQQSSLIFGWRTMWKPWVRWGQLEWDSNTSYLQIRQVHLPKALLQQQALCVMIHIAQGEGDCALEAPRAVQMLTSAFDEYQLWQPQKTVMDRLYLVPFLLLTQSWRRAYKGEGTFCVSQLVTLVLEGCEILIKRMKENNEWCLMLPGSEFHQTVGMRAVDGVGHC